MQDRYRYIDETRAVGILMVVTCHICNASGLGNPIRDWFNPFMMGLFFMISGYIQNKRSKKDDFTAFVVRRLKGLAVPYCFFSLTSAVFQLVVAYENSLSAGAAAMRLFTDFITLKGFGPLWFLPVMFLADLGFYLVIRGKRLIHGLTVAAAVLAACYSGELSHLFGAQAVWMGNYTVVLLKAVVGLGVMVIGYYVLPLTDRLVKTYTLCLGAAISLAGSIGIAGIYNLDFNGLDFGRLPILFFVDTVLGTVFVILCCRIADGIRPWRFLSYLGENTLIILSTHTEWLLVPLIQLGWSQLAGGGAAVVGERYYAELIIKLFFVMTAEVGIIELLHKYCPFIPGKSMNHSS